MLNIKNVSLTLLGLMLASSPDANAEERDRGKIPDRYKWKLTDLYPDEDTWRQSKASIAQALPKIGEFRGKLSNSAQDLLACLEMTNNISREMRKLATYAGLSSDLDTRDSTQMGMKQEIGPLHADFEAADSFIDPEILKAGRDRIETFLVQEPRLAPYRHSLEDILRRASHTGSVEEEKIIADASLMADAPGSIYNIFSNAEFPYAEVTLSDGKKVHLDQAAFGLYRTVPNREDRQKVFETYFGKLQEYRRTYGAQLYANVKTHLFFMKARKYASTLESALDSNNIPTTVYQNLVASVNANLPTFHRYLKLRQRMMGLEQLHYYDLYAPLVHGVDLKYSIEEAEKHVVASLAPLGDEYARVVQKAFEERWIDAFPTTGKRSGAYSNGSVYDTHPFILMNYHDLYSDMSTLSHELGHTMHSYLSNKTQPYPTASYPIFVAEVASTFNEALLIDYLLKNIQDDKIRLSLLGNYLEGFKGTLFRQTHFAEFELRMHEKAEKGEALTGDALNQLYADITHKYYGHAQKTCIVDDHIKSEWSFVPHFYYNYYVYQYATAFTASTALSEQVLAGNPEAKKRYLEFLSSGGSDYPIELLKKAGVDMSSSQPFDLTIRKMNKVMDEIEKILAKQQA